MAHMHELLTEAFNRLHDLDGKGNPMSEAQPETQPTEPTEPAEPTEPTTEPTEPATEPQVPEAPPTPGTENEPPLSDPDGAAQAAAPLTTES